MYGQNSAVVFWLIWSGINAMIKFRIFKILKILKKCDKEFE